MQNFAYEILINVIGFFVGVLFTWIYSSTKQFYARRVLRTFWVSQTNKITIVYGTESKIQSKHSDVDTIKFDFNSAGEASLYLRIFTEISICSDQDNVVKENNLFIIGGPLTNRLTKEFAALLTPYFFFYDLDVDNRELCNRSKTARFFSDFDDQGNIIHDVGWFIRDLNPLNSNSIVVVAAGNYAFGTHAAIRFITDNKRLKELRIGRKDRVEGIIGVTVENERMISIYPLVLRKR